MQGSPGAVAAHAQRNGYQHSRNLGVNSGAYCQNHHQVCMLLLLLLLLLFSFVVIFVVIIFVVIICVVGLDGIIIISLVLCSSEPYVASLVKACVRNR